jgi:fructuronate reductase
MKRLGNDNLPLDGPGTSLFSYNRERCESGIVHFGAGNFHRTHQAVYCDDLLCQGETQWGITGVSLRSAKLRDALAPQDFLYTQVTLGPDTDYRIVGSIKDILVAPENPAAVIDAVASSQTHVVTTTITEKGYYLSSGVLDDNHPDIRKDTASLDHPHTIYGYLAAAIIKRCHNGGTPVTIICCDNIQGGGEHLQTGVIKLLTQHCEKSCSWAEQGVAFISSMVDRVSPATDEQLKQSVALQLQVIDEWPVAAEPFSQWIIEDKFAGKRPPFDKAGAVFVKDIAPYEQMKLRFLNAGHSITATLGYLAGDQFIHQALLRPPISSFVKQTLLNNVLPVTQTPDGIDGKAYTQQVLTRFQNSALPYAVLQVGTDSSQKIQQRWLPTCDDALELKGDTSYLAFTLAAWVVYIRKALNSDELIDPLRGEFCQIENGDEAATVRRFLTLAGAEKFCFMSHTAFMASVNNHYQVITDLGIDRALVDFLDTVDQST